MWREAEMESCCCKPKHTKEERNPSEAGRDMEGFSPEPSEEAQCCQNLDFGYLASTTVKKGISVVLSYPVYDDLLEVSQETDIHTKNKMRICNE